MSVIDRIKSVVRGRGRDESERLRSEKLDARGSEILDSTPMEPPLGYRKQPSMFDVMRKLIADREFELSQAGFETPEEADDFDVQDDFDPSSPYEHNFDPPASPDTSSPEVPPGASGKAVKPPSDGPGTPPADPAGDGSKPPSPPPAAKS